MIIMYSKVYSSMPLRIKKGEEKSYETGYGENYHPEYRTAVWVLIMSFSLCFSSVCVMLKVHHCHDRYLGDAIMRENIFCFFSGQQVNAKDSCLMSLRAYKYTTMANQGPMCHRMINRYECRLGREKYVVPVLKRVGGSYMRHLC